MAEYKTIKGFKTVSYAIDPVAGQVAGGTWASGGDITQNRTDHAGFGNPAASTAMIAGGWVSPGVGYTLKTESYNGSAWTEVNDLTGTAVGGAGSTGTSTAGVYFGGLKGAPSPAPTNVTQEFDGTSWTSGGNLNTSRRDVASGGTQTAAFAAFGAIDPPFTTAAETYNGTAWTSVNSGNTARRSLTGSGSSTAALAYGGYIEPAYTGKTESYDGTSWGEVADMNELKATMGGTHSGTNTSALSMGGYGGPPGSQKFDTAEYFDGATWTQMATLAVARNSPGGGGIATDCFICGGATPLAPGSPAYSVTSEFFSAPGIFNKLNEGQVWYNTTTTALKYTAGIGAWSSGGNLNSDRWSLAAAGTQTAG